MQGFPKFVAAAFVRTSDEGGLIQVYNDPFKLETILRGGGLLSGSFLNCDNLFREIVVVL